MKTIRKNLFIVCLLFLLFMSCSNQTSGISSHDWTEAIEETLSNFVYNKKDANYFVQNQEFYDGWLEVVEFKSDKNHSKHTDIRDAGSSNEKRISRFLSLETDGVYAYVENPDFDENDPSSLGYFKMKTDLPFISGQTVAVFLLGPDNKFHGFEERIANYEPMFMDFMIAIKDNFDWVILKNGKYVVKEEKHADMWAAYVQRGRKLSTIEMSEIYFIIQDGIVTECGFSGWDNDAEVKHVYHFQFGNISFDFPNNL